MPETVEHLAGIVNLHFATQVARKHIRHSFAISLRLGLAQRREDPVKAKGPNVIKILQKSQLNQARMDGDSAVAELVFQTLIGASATDTNHEAPALWMSAVVADDVSVVELDYLVAACPRKQRNEGGQNV